MVKAKKRTAATPLSQQRGSNKRVNRTNLVVKPSLTGPRVESLESASHEIQPEASSTTATTTLPESKERNAVHSTTIPAAKSEDSSVLSKHPGKNFMDLPRELRDMIYYHALVPLDSASQPKWEEQAHIRLGSLVRLEWNQLKRDMADLGVASPKTCREISPRINTALFYTNHTLKAEAEAVFYKHNTFTLSANCKLRRLYVHVGDWSYLIQRHASPTRVGPVQMDEAREAQIRAVGEAQKTQQSMHYAMDEVRAYDAQTNFLAALPALRELTIDYYFFRYSSAYGFVTMERLVAGIVYDKMKGRPELGLPPVRVHLCGLAIGDLQDAFEWSQWYKPSDCTGCTGNPEVSWA